jgi:hypothetical protein
MRVRLGGDRRIRRQRHRWSGHGWVRHCLRHPVCGAGAQSLQLTQTELFAGRHCREDGGELFEQIAEAQVRHGPQRTAMPPPDLSRAPEYTGVEHAATASEPVSSSSRPKHGGNKIWAISKPGPLR